MDKLNSFYNSMSQENFNIMLKEYSVYNTFNALNKLYMNKYEDEYSLDINDIKYLEYKNFIIPFKFKKD